MLINDFICNTKSMIIARNLILSINTCIPARLLIRFLLLRFLLHQDSKECSSFHVWEFFCVPINYLRHREQEEGASASNLIYHWKVFTQVKHSRHWLHKEDSDDLRCDRSEKQLTVKDITESNRFLCAIEMGKIVIAVNYSLSSAIDQTLLLCSLSAKW